MILLVTTLLLGCGRCGSFFIESPDGVVDGAIEECGPLSGSFAEDDGGTVRLALIPASTDRQTDDLLVSLSPELLLTIPADALQAGVTTQAVDLYGTASVFSDSQGQRLVANLVDGQLTVEEQTGQSLVGEPRWRMDWQLVFESDDVRVEAEGRDRIDIIQPTQVIQ